MLNYLCIPKIPTGHHILSFLLLLGSVYENIVENFSSVFTKDIGRLFSFTSYFGIRVILVSQNKLVSIPFFNIFGRVCVELPLFLIFGRIHCGKVFNNKLNFSNIDTYFFGGSFVVCVFQGICLFHLSC